MKILFTVMPYEGQVRDRITDNFFKNDAVKYMPLGILSVAACLPEHDVKILDASSLGLTLDETIEEIETWQPDVLALSVVTYRAWAMVEILKRTTAKYKVVGGPHATFNAKNILRQGADAVFTGDAEELFPHWIGKLNRTQWGYEILRGTFRGGTLPLDSLPFPARHLVDLKDYEIVRNEDMLFDVGKMRLPMYSSKGCPLKCIYCDVQQKTFNFKSAERCVHEMNILIDMGATSIHILDDAFNIKKERVIEMSELLIKEGIEIDWSARGTVETRGEVVGALGRAGCKRLHVGIEHLEDKILAYFKKAQRVSHITRFCDLAMESGIDILGYFIIGAPGETEQYRRDLPDRIDDLGIRMPFFNTLSPLAETPYYTELLWNRTWQGRDPWAEFCKDPVKDFVMPSARSPSEDLELQATIDEYVDHFNRREMPVFV